MSVEVKLLFSTVAEAAAFLAATMTATVAPTPDKVTKGKPAPAASPAAASPSVSPSPAAVPATPPAASPAPAAESAELPYAPLAERITGAIAASNPNSAANRVALKALFAELEATYSTPAKPVKVKTGSDIKAADRGRLLAVLDEIAPAAAEEAMS